MERKIFFDDARTNVLEFFSIEFPSMTLDQVEHFINKFYKLVNYEEESQKIRPAIIITSNINSIVKNVSNAKKILFYEDEDISNFKMRIKALMCFCRSDWTMYVNFGEEIIEYGIIKKLTSIKEKTLINEIKKKSTLETLSKKTNLVSSKNSILPSKPFAVRVSASIKSVRNEPLQAINLPKNKTIS